MYIPEHFRARDHADTIGFMRANPFAILVSPAGASPETSPFATHLPLVIRDEGERLILRGHVAKANPHWRYLEQQPRCLTIFHGPHSYISPTNYAARENVPTWNYGAVHVYGTARVFAEPAELLGILHELIPLFEPAYADQWAGLSPAYRERMLGHIIGFEITATDIEAKFKLSQNRTRDEQENVIHSLIASSDTVVSGVAQLMREQKLGTKERPASTPAGGPHEK